MCALLVWGLIRGETRFGIVERNASSYLEVSGLFWLMLTLVVGIGGWRTCVCSFSRRARESSSDWTVSAMVFDISRWMCGDFV
jgi:hypothetical protein